MINKNKKLSLFLTLFSFFIFLTSCQSEMTDSKTDSPGIYITLNTPYRNAAPDALDDISCYAGLVKSGNQITDDKIQKLTKHGNSWYYKMESSEMLNTGAHDFYIFAAALEEEAKSIEKAPLYAKITLQITNSVIKYTESANLTVNSLSSKKGSINLKVNTPANKNFNYVILNLSAENTNTDFTNCLTASETEITNNTFTIQASSIPAGTYNLLLKFYDEENGNLIFLRSETIEVWPNSKTNKWYLENGQPGECLTISESMISSTYFVRGSSPALYDSAIKADNPSDIASGGITSPLENISEAVKRIISANDESTTYSIYLDGTNTLTETIKIVSQKELKIDIKSLSENKEKSIIDGNNLVQCITVGRASNSQATTVNLINITIKNGKSDCGAGLYLNKYAQVTLQNSKIESCNANDSGGGAYIDNGATLVLKDSTFNSNTANLNGGAVYNSGSFKIDGDTYLPCGTDISNDVYLEENKTVIVSESISTVENRIICAITPSEEKCGLEVVSAENPSTDISQLKDYFIIKSDTFEPAASVNNNSVLSIDAPIYIAGSNYKICKQAGDDTDGCGSKNKPYASLTKALTDINESDIDYRIYLDGTITGSSVIINSDITNSTLLLMGVNGLNESDEPTDTITANGFTILDVNTSLPITLKNIKLQGSSSSTGLLLEENAKVTISDNVLITGNESGGGVYINKNALLTMTGGKISNNTSTGKTNNGIAVEGQGGGVYIAPEGRMEMSGGTISNNTAEGYAYGNFKEGGKGGGIYISYLGNLTMTGGTISNNTASDETANKKPGQGGGLYIAKEPTASSEGGKLFLSGGLITENTASNGGGIYNDWIMFLYDNPIISQNTVNKCNNNNGQGGGLFNASGSFAYLGYSFTNNEITKTDWTGSINNNNAESSGSGIYADGSVFFDSGKIYDNKNRGITVKGILEMTGGKIHDNTTAEIYVAGGTLNLSGSPYIYNGYIELKTANTDFITITGDITPQETCEDGIIATISIPESPTSGTKVLEVENASSLTTTQKIEKISNIKTSNDAWFINTNGEVRENSLVNETYYPTLKSTIEAIKNTSGVLNLEVGALTADELGKANNDDSNKNILVAIKNTKAYETNLKFTKSIQLGEDASNMFSLNNKFKSIDLNNCLDTSNVTNMSYMFYNCANKLTSLNLSGINTSKVTNMEHMFNYSTGLTNLDLSSFNTSEVTNMNCMFSTCTNLASINVSSFDTSKVTTMSSMFSSIKVQTLDLSNFSWNSINCTESMFHSNENLETIYVKAGTDLSSISNSNYMFHNNKKLKGYKGTTFNSEKTDSSYAKVDGGTSNPGYFSVK